MSNRRFKKGTFLKKVRFYFFIKLFLHTFFFQKRTFCYPTNISYGKRQKSCTLIVI